MKSYLSPKVKRSKSAAGDGLFVTERIQKGEVVADFSQGPGTYLSTAEADKLYEQGSDYMLQVGDDKFFAATNSEELEDADFINHSCEPNCGIKGSLAIVAMRDIEPGEEIAFDYCMSESSEFSFECQCGAATCRGVVTGKDWQNPELQAKYRGYFSDYLARKMA